MRLVVIMLLFACCVSAQTDKPSSVGGSVLYPADEASVDRSIPTYKLQGAKREELLLLPLPEVRFVFASETAIVTDLSPDAKSAVEAHWKQALFYFYYDEFARPQTPRDISERGLRWLKACDKTRRQLMRIEIEAPNGKRRMSFKEASETFTFLNHVAIHVIEKWKELNAKDYRASL